MKNTRPAPRIACILGVSALILGACSNGYGPRMPGKTNHFAPGMVNQVGPYGAPMRGMRPHKRNFHKPRHTNPMPPQRMIAPQFQQWIDYEPEYKLYPGDQVDIVVSSAPELSRTLTVGPDGRVVMPMIEPTMASGRTFVQLQQSLSAQLARQLRDPRVAVTPRAYAPQQIFVGGEVGQQGTYGLSGPTGVLEAIIMAGGLQTSAKSRKIAVLRRAPNGGMMMRAVDIGGGMKDIHRYNDVIQLRRGDIIFVPRNTLAEISMWVQAVRSALPVDFNLSYQIGAGGDNGTTVIAP